MSGVDINLDLTEHHFIRLDWTGHLTRECSEADVGGRGGYGGGGSYILLRNKLQSYHVDKVIMSVSRTDEDEDEITVKCEILLQTSSFSANSTVKFNVGL